MAKKKLTVKRLWLKWLSSFDNNTRGFSARKLTTFAFVVLTIVIEIVYVDTSVVSNVAVANMLFVLLLLGIITFEQVIRFKNGGKTQDQVDVEEDISVEEEKSGVG